MSSRREIGQLKMDVEWLRGDLEATMKRHRWLEGKVVADANRGVKEEVVEEESFGFSDKILQVINHSFQDISLRVPTLAEVEAIRALIDLYFDKREQ